MGRLVTVGDTRLFVEQQGHGPALIVLHGGPGADHTQLLEPLSGLCNDFTLYFVDQRAQGRSDEAPSETWTIRQAANDVTRLAEALNLPRYALLGHSYGALVALRHAADYPRHAAASVVSHGVPSVSWYRLEEELEAFEPLHLRARVASAWAELATVEDAGRAAELIAAQAPFHFKDPESPLVDEMKRNALEVMIHKPLVNRHMSERHFDDFHVEGDLDRIMQPVQILAGRADRVCVAEASAFMHERIVGSELRVFEESGHVSYLEERERYTSAVRDFLRRHLV